jgi:hypothetical protein
MVTMLLALQTPAMPDAVRRMASLSAGSARSPISSSFDSRASKAATPARMAAMTKEATPSQRASPVRSVAVVPAAATAIPSRAAESSKTTMKAGGSFDLRNASHHPRFPLAAPKARMLIHQDVPSKAREAASTANMTPGLSMGCGTTMWLKPS